ncbi:MAG: tryptophan synthase subunit alpha [Schwartzia sp.]|nr:tryptophan synthase subunit alpha [Schwartzia sp. (in: firmicutes)]
MTRIEKKFAALKDAKKKGLVIYLMAGVPDAKGTIEAVKMAARAGADFIEIGLPFSDPLADGPVIQAAGIRALKGGMTLAGVLRLAREIRAFTEIPLIGMGYINNVLHYGAEKFVADAKAAGLDGAILPDVPHEESAELREICKAHDFRLIEFVTPGTTPGRLAQTCESANGFIYAVSVNGVTGEKKIDYSMIGSVARKVRRETDVPIAVGFGIGSPEAAVDAAKDAEAVIVGSAVVRRLMDGQTREAEDFIASLRHALDAAF